LIGLAIFPALFCLAKVNLVLMYGNHRAAGMNSPSSPRYMELLELLRTEFDSMQQELHLTRYQQAHSQQVNQDADQKSK